MALATRKELNLEAVAPSACPVQIGADAQLGSKGSGFKSGNE